MATVHSFWQKKTVIVTGGAGFLGSHVVELLEERGVAKIIVPRSKEFDLTSEARVNDLIASTKPDIIIHLAAVVGGIGANKINPAKYFHANLTMGVHLLHQAHVNNVSKFVGVGTICSYPKFCPIPFKEDHIWDGYPEETNAPYGLAKKMMMVGAQAYKQQYGLNAITLLPVNLYGPGDNFSPKSSHVIPALIKKVLEAKAENRTYVNVWGDGTPTREFLYVEDAALGIVEASEKYDSQEPMNLGTGKEISIKDLTRVIADLCEFDGEVIFDTSKPNGQPRRCLDVSRAKKTIGFEAKTDFRDGLRNTIDWYTKNCISPEPTLIKLDDRGQSRTEAER